MITRLHDEFSLGAKAIAQEVHIVFSEANESERNVFQVTDPDAALQFAELVKSEAMKAKGQGIVMPSDDDLKKPPGF